MENQEQTNTPQNQGFDFKSMDTKKKALVIGAGIGIIGCFLPFVSFMGFSISLLDAGGLGYLVFFGLIAIGLAILFGDKMNMSADQIGNMIKYGIIGIAVIWFLNLLRLDGLSFQLLGIGFYIVTLSLAFLLLVQLNVIKLEK